MNILLGVTGSISAYKSIDLARLLYKQRHKVRVILTKGANEFVNPKVFRYLGVEKVYNSGDDFDKASYETLDGTVLHIELAKWADTFCLYPLSANTLAKFVHAQCDDLLSTTFLALDEQTPKVFFPAMNTKMLTHPFVQENLKKLSELKQTYVNPTASGLLACGEEGHGKLEDVETAADLIETLNFKSTNKTVLLTTGATISALDPVRYLTNPSSGKTGYYMAREFLAKGHKVIVIASTTSTPQLQRLKTHPCYELMLVNSTSEMKEVVDKYFKNCDYYISAAAISDIEFDFNQEKIKKTTFDEGLKIKRSPDILKGILEHRKHQKIIGFAAETGESTDIFLKKLHSKPVDLLIGNFVSNGIGSEKQGFGTEDNNYFFISQEKINPMGDLNKKDLASHISSWMELN